MCGNMGPYGAENPKLKDFDTCGLNALYEIRKLVEPVPGKLMQDELVGAVRRIIAERDAARATIAKLPTYANGEAFVPGLDPCFCWSGSMEVAFEVQPHCDNPWHYAMYYRCYPTAAECEAAERKEQGR